MNIFPLHQFEPGKAYLVSHRKPSVEGQQTASRKVRRIYKGMEHRFGEIPCAVFTAKVDAVTRASYDQNTKTLTLSGKRLPQSEISIPHYDLMTAEPA